MSFQQLIITGNLGRDPELRYTPQGVGVCDFSIAVNTVKGSGDNRQEDAMWFKVTAWRQSAEACAKYLKKGSQVLVCGRLGEEKWTDRDGNARTSLTIQSDRVEFLNNTLTAEERGEQPEAQSHTGGEVQSAFHDTPEPAKSDDDFD